MDPAQVIRECLPTYRVVRALGEGVYGTVLCIGDGLKERAAKVVPLVVERSLSHPTRTDLDSKISQDFHAVREYYEKIEGPGVLKVLDFHLVGKEVNETSAQAHLVILMELCAQNLRDHVLDRRGRLPVDEALSLTAELARVLRRLAHECGQTFLVTDLKPANLLFTAQGNLVIGDLGGLKRLASVSSTARAQFTPDWSAPETILRAEEPRVPSIVYSFGLVSHFIWEGRLPHDQADFIERIRLIKEKGAEFTRKDVPPAVADLARQCLAFEPQDRPAGFGQVCEVLDKALADRPPAPKPAPRKRAPRKSPGAGSGESPAPPLVAGPGPEPESAPIPEPESAHIPDPRPSRAPEPESAPLPAQAQAPSGSMSLDPAGRWALCPQCGRSNRVPAGRALSRLSCRFCEAPMGLSPAALARSFLLSVAVAGLGWAAAAGVQAVALAQASSPLAWAPGWAAGGVAVGAGLTWAAPGFSRRHALLAALSFALAGAVARRPEALGLALSAGASVAGALGAGVAIRLSMPRFSWDLVAVHALVWTAALALSVIFFEAGGLKALGVLPPRLAESRAMALSAMEALAAPAGMAVTFLLARRAARPMARKGGTS